MDRINVAWEFFKPVKTNRAFEEVSQNIKSLVFKGILKPGDKLPSEVELAKQFNVGRQTVREALRLLELSGFIAVQKGSNGGPIIQNTIQDAISRAFVDAVQMDRTTIDELTTARLKIEKSILKYAIDNCDNSDIVHLKENVLRAKKKTVNGIQAFSENIDFHRLLAKASKNHVFVVVEASIMAVVAHFLSDLEPDLGKSKHVVRCHHNLVEAIVQRQHREAWILLEQHLLEISSWLSVDPY